VLLPHRVADQFTGFADRRFAVPGQSATIF
jgi:hypothetical protein